LVKELVVSGAFHSGTYGKRAGSLKAGLDRTTFRDARIPVYAT